MQKKLIAAALATLASSAAMAQVTIYGRLDFGYNATETEISDGVDSFTTKSSSTGFNQGALTTSRLGFNASEDLGGGLTAKANLELGVANTATSGTLGFNAAGALPTADTTADNGTDTAAPFTTRLANVGLAGSFGTFTIGRQNVLVDLIWQLGNTGGSNNVTGAAYSSLSADTTTTLTSLKYNNSRSSNMLVYNSPVMSGLQINAAYGKGDSEASATGLVGAEDSHEEMGISATYTMGPLNVGIGYSSEETKNSNILAATATTNQPEQLVISANYDFGVVKAFALFADGENKKNEANLTDGDERQIIEVGVRVPLGATTLLASYYDGDQKFEEAGVAKDELSGYQLGAIYSFSKRTSAYALYGANELKDTTAGSNFKFEANQFAMGLRHDF